MSGLCVLLELQDLFLWISFSFPFDMTKDGADIHGYWKTLLGVIKSAASHIIRVLAEDLLAKFRAKDQSPFSPRFLGL